MSKADFNHISFKAGTTLSFYAPGNDYLNSVYALLAEDGFVLEGWLGSHPVNSASFKNASTGAKAYVRYDTVAPEKSRVIFAGKIFNRGVSFEDFIANCARARVQKLLAAEKEKIAQTKTGKGKAPKNG